MVEGTNRTDAARQVELLHRIDPLAGLTHYVSTDIARIQDSTFLDGRECFWDRVQTRPIVNHAGRTQGMRFLFHMGFCGSTLLARLLGTEGTLVMREPQCLTDIAATRTRILAGQAEQDLAGYTSFALNALGAVAPPEEALLIKPSNWANSLIEPLVAACHDPAALYLTTEPRAFLRAAFRGGRDRLEFCIRLAVELAAAVPGANDRLRQATSTGPDPLDRAARIVTLLWAMQRELFARAMACANQPASCLMDYAELVEDPQAAAIRAAQLLGLPAPDFASSRVQALLGRHSKDPQSAYDPARRSANDAELERHHAARFDTALEWLDSQTAFGA